MLDEAFRIYRRNFGYLVTISVAAFAPVAVIGALLGAIGAVAGGPLGGGSSGSCC